MILSTRLGWLLVAGLLCWLIFTTSTAPERAAAGFLAPPFARAELLLAHVFAAMPLALLLATRIQRPVSTWIGIALGLISVLAIHLLHDFLISLTTDFIGRSLVRSAISLTVILPWCLLTVQGWPKSNFISKLAAGLFCILAPSFYAERLSQEQLANAQELLNRGRLAKARVMIDVLSDYHPKLRLPVDQHPKELSEVRSELDAILLNLANQVKRPPTSRTPIAGRLAYGDALLALGRLEDAAGVFRQLPVATARLKLGETLQELGRWSESDRALRQGLDELLPQSASDSQIASTCQIAFDNLARNAQEQGQFAIVQALYLEAIEKLPTSRAYFHFQLGRLAAGRGRPFDALQHFSRAEELNAEFGPKSEPYRVKIRELTPGCLVSR